MCNMNVTSAHGMLDNGKGYNKVLNWLSAKDEMWIEGWSTTCYSETTVILQVHECINIRKYLEKETWKTEARIQRSETWNVNKISRKWEKFKRRKK